MINSFVHEIRSSRISMAVDFMENWKLVEQIEHETHCSISNAASSEKRWLRICEKLYSAGKSTYIIVYKFETAVNEFENVTERQKYTLVFQ